MPESLATECKVVALAPKRVPELDGLRAFAIVPVILYHCYPSDGWLGWIRFAGEVGWMGVDLFFVLSGYLITGILLDTVHRPHYYRNFIVRRTLRIFPLYYVCLALLTAGALAGPGLWKEMQQWGGIGWFFVYLANVRIAWVGSFPPLFSFVPLWSLQVEEQFYLLYPLLVFLLSIRNLRRLLIACVVVAPLLRLILSLVAPANTPACIVLTPCRMDALAIGGLVAMMSRTPSRQFSPSKLRWSAAVAGALASAIYVVSWHAEVGTTRHLLMTTLGGSFVALTCAAVLYMVILGPSTWLNELLRLRPLVYTGQISYGLYLLHGPAYFVVRKLLEVSTGIQTPAHSGLAVPVMFVASFAAASLSWRFFESPILGLKDRFTIPDRQPREGALTSATAI